MTSHFPEEEKIEINTALGMGQGGCPGRDIKNLPKGKKLSLQIEKEVIRVDSELTSSPTAIAEMARGQGAVTGAGRLWPDLMGKRQRTKRGWARSTGPFSAAQTPGRGGPWEKAASLLHPFFPHFPQFPELSLPAYFPMHMSLSPET